MRCNHCQPLPERVARTAALLGRRWVLAILWASSEAGAVRFNEFKQALEDIPPRTLALRLVELEQARGLNTASRAEASASVRSSTRCAPGRRRPSDARRRGG